MGFWPLKRLKKARREFDTFSNIGENLMLDHASLERAL